MSAKKKGGARKRAAAKRTRDAKSVKTGAHSDRPPTRSEREEERVNEPTGMCDERELAFIDEWMGPSRFNGTRAMIAAGICNPDEPRSAAVRASEWLNKPHVLAEITRRREERRKAIEHANERLMQEQLAIALANIGDAMKWDGAQAMVMPPDALEEDTLAAIAEVAFIPGKFGDRVSVKMHDKSAAITQLQKMLQPTPQERRRNVAGIDGDDTGGVAIYIDGGPTGLEITVTKKDAA